MLKRIKKWHGVSIGAVGAFTVLVLLALPPHHSSATRAKLGEEKYQRISTWHPSRPTHPPLPNPVTTPPPSVPRIIVDNDQVVNAGAMAPMYHLTPNGPMQITGYVDARWNVVAGSEVTNPSVGVVITYYLAPNNPGQPIQQIYQVPGAGTINVVGFQGNLVELRSATGTGSFNLQTRQTTWKANG
ncbi:hypothetical protein TPY_3486 [Sulfobacillus acidophilus TPY]|uniref:Uncharacterized protein n=1 Tax=Sulfobacillus acidophilus (strain ATCC 700253 / DSM 10332 / NAL) TaxID=679936 RepID=G8TX18_SULAD|nr:hypothetical protein TPY_3486 [Sulfobacillus acidophilus TPY]AEW04926.1 hypothetical protein Sulac_1429 [Sulfobacillus acidophilus DSM 10332]